MNIYSCVDYKNIDKIIILFNSVYENADVKKRSMLRFYLLIDELPETFPYIPDYLTDIINIKALNINLEWLELLNSFNSHFYKHSVWCKNNMNFARFLFFNNFPEVNRVIYLDWDMIVLADIFKLESEYKNLDKMIVAKCGESNLINNIFKPNFIMKKNYFDIIYRNNNVLKSHNIIKILNNLQIEYGKAVNSKSFNAGFYIISKNHFEESYMINLIRDLINIQKKLNCFNFGTQVVMNLMHLNDRYFIEKEWNHLPDLDNKNLKIIHWNGKNKPWNGNSNNLNSKIWYLYCYKVYPKFYPKKNYKVNNDPKQTNPKKIINKKNLELIKFLNSKKY